MTPDKDRQKARRQRLKAQGWRDVDLWLPPDLIERLDALATDQGESRVDVIRHILQAAVKTPERKSESGRRR